MCAASWKMSGTSTPFRASLQKRPLRWDGAAAWKPSAMCMLLLEQGQQVSQVGVGALCAQLSDSPKSMEQRARRAVERGLHHLASLGLEDYGNEIFTLYASRLFPFQEVRAEMACIQGRGPKGKANLKRFLDGMLVLVEED